MMANSKEASTSSRRKSAVTSLPIGPSTCVKSLKSLTNLVWDDNLIYIASKKAYLIMHKENGNILQSITHDKLSK